ncbi:uncharacterized protein DSM5745_09480 [Aspergillus mulundensis]|uniref:N-acetyltransferase domain-containing protein n=1 Tax=Aspergillus mulundensis TaxID=1810919 RepID=A0A3D8QVM3_9EURO|nr:hypothetical protein DSM5745_09480 [Aspergillus mulundensis]RDW65741.1 hypothetical protein DSM5745_09480 [Aspergillus mulundensis]
MATQDQKPVVLAIPKREHLSSAEAISTIVNKSKTLRLTALKRSPSAFTSTYAREIQFNEDTWTNRAFNPLTRIYIALSPSATSANIRPESNEDNGSHSIEQILIDRRWLGQVTLMGPVVLPTDGEKANSAPWELFKGLDFEQAATDAQGIPPGSKVVYVLLGMYVLPEKRGVGHGRSLLEAATGTVREEAKGKKVDATLVVLVGRENERAKKLYERVGFVPWEETVDVEGEEHWPLSLDVGQ